MHLCVKVSVCVRVSVFACLCLLQGRRKMGKQRQWQGIQFTLCYPAWFPRGVQLQELRHLLCVGVCLYRGQDRNWMTVYIGLSVNHTKNVCMFMAFRI